MEYNAHNFEVPERLKNYVSKFELYQQEEDDLPVHAMLPVGVVQIIFQYGNTISHRTNFTKGWEERPNIFIGGPFDFAYELMVNPGNKVFSIQFEAAKIRYFLPCPVSELRNKLIVPEDIWGDEGMQLVEQIGQEDFGENTLKIAEEFLLQKLQPLKVSTIEKIIDYIYQCKGICKVEQLAHMANLSISRFRQRFHNELGLSPKTFLKLVRINSLIRFFFKNPSVSLTDLTYQFGYFDQSHFVKEFKMVTGKAPFQALKS